MAWTSQLSDKETPTARVLLSRQPVFDRDQKVFGYELLFRDSDSDHASFSDGMKATAQVIVHALMEIGLNEMVGQHRAFINFERKLLMNNYYEALPPSRVVIEILESVEPDPELLRRLGQLRAKGYKIALDDFVCSEPYVPLLRFADYVKLDVLAHSWPELDRAVSIVSQYPVEIIAEKVETREQMQRCKDLGFKYFQGYFFCRPQNLTGKPLPANRLAMIELLTQMNKPDIKIEDLEHTISQDVSLSYRLLRYINSAMCSLDREVESIRHATVMVGLEKMRIWASLIVFSAFEESSQELIVIGAVRARMCEQLAMTFSFRNPERHFLVGLFSVLDAILDRRMEDILAMLSLSEEIKHAILNNKGELGAVLGCVQSYERRDWGNLQASVKVTHECLEKTYAEALAWSAKLVGLTRRH